MKKFKAITKMKYLKAIWQFCGFLFVPQMGKQRRKKELLKKDVTYLIGKERTEGNQEELTAEYISRVLGADLNDVREALKEINE